MVRSSGQRIGLSVGRPLAVDDGVGVGRESSRPPGMASRRSTSSTEVLEVLVVRVDLHRCSSSLQVDPLVFERLHDNKQLLVIDGVVELDRAKLPRVVADRMELAIGVGLGQDASECKV